MKQSTIPEPFGSYDPSRVRRRTILCLTRRATMSETGNLPSRVEIIELLQGLIVGDATREEVALWASSWIPRLDEIDDPQICRALDRLSGADAPSTDRQYLFMAVDFEAWMGDLT